MQSNVDTSQFNNIKVWIPTLVAALLSLFIVSYVDRLEKEQHIQEVHSQTLKHLGILSSSIENQIHHQLHLFEGLARQIALKPTIADEEITQIAGHMVEEQKLLRSFGFSHEYTIAGVYPFKGNESVIGVSYLNLPKQLPDIEKAIRTRETVISGPVELLQGGSALIARMPIFSEISYNNKPSDSFWGILSVLINLEQLYGNITKASAEHFLDVAIRTNTPGPSTNDKIIYGEPQLFNDPLSSTLTIHFPTGSWTIVGKSTVESFEHIRPHRKNALILGIIAAILFVLMTHFFTRQYLQQGEIIKVQNTSREQILHAATHDRLTGMANRHLFNEELDRLVALAEREQQTLAVLFLDLDRFKSINDSFGHHTGDLFLQEFANRLRKEVRKTELLARLGGDEFAIVALNLTLEHVADLAHRISQSLNTPIIIDHHSLNAGVSIGISIYPNNGQDTETLLHHADIAMYEAKQNPLGSYSFFEEAMNKAAAERKTLVDNIRKALINKEFHLVYQPIINIQNGQFIGMEALTRWQHPELGTISPAEFIPAAKSSGLIIPLGEWVLETALEEMQDLLKSNPTATLSINLSPIQLYDSDLIDKISKILSKTTVTPNQLDIEITESTILEEVEVATTIIHQIRKLGVSVSIDDFGTGYSSLSHLQQLPVSRIKVDCSFVSRIGIDSNSEAIIKAIFFLSSLMGVRVTAEGVETEEQLNFLKKEGCEEVQGYFFSRPIKVDALKAYCEKLERSSTKQQVS